MKLQECMVSWLAFFSLPSHQHNFKNITPNNIMFLWTLETGCGKTMSPIWQSQVGTFLFILLNHDVVFNRTKPIHRWSMPIFIFIFRVVEFLYKDWLPDQAVWSLFSLCGLPVPQPLTTQACPSMRSPCFVRARWPGVSLPTVGVEFAGCPLCCTSNSHSCRDC